MRTVSMLLLLFALSLVSVSSIAASSHDSSTTRPAELVVRLRNGTGLLPSALARGPDVAALNAVLQRVGAVSAETSPGAEFYRVRLRSGVDVADAATLLRGQAAVVYAEPNFIRTAQRIPNDTLFDRQWALRAIRAVEAWDITTGNDIPIAILDTGVSPDHPDLMAKLLPGFDFQAITEQTQDDDGHGTFTAGIVAAESNNAQGATGVCWGCTIMPVKVLDQRGQGDDATIAAGIIWAVDHGARIINLSLGGPDDSQTLRDAVEYAYAQNVLIVAASGNGQSGGNVPNYPAAYPSVLAVAATNEMGTVTPFSTTGAYVDIAAPGESIWSTSWASDQGNSYGVASGTSTASPQVAGAAGLLLSHRANLTPDQITELLELSADDAGPPGKDPAYGYGRLNIQQALRLLDDPATLQRSRIEGLVIANDPAAATVTLSTGQQTQPDGAGNFVFSGLPAGTYDVTVTADEETKTDRVTLSGTALSVAAVRFNFQSDESQYFARVNRTGNGVYFPTTGHMLQGVFLAYWSSHGGLPIFGYPISEAFVGRGDDGQEYAVQYFERHRFEYHPDAAPPYHVQLARIGDLVLRENRREWFTFPHTPSGPACLSFAETDHAICEPFLRYWRSHGIEFDGKPGFSQAENLALFGMPLSSPQLETLSNGEQYLVQWFERARLEDHVGIGVLAGLLGNELASVRGWR